MTEGVGGEVRWCASEGVGGKVCGCVGGEQAGGSTSE